MIHSLKNLLCIALCFTFISVLLVPYEGFAKRKNRRAQRVQKKNSLPKKQSHTQNTWALGLLLGKPSGITAQYKLKTDQAIQGLLAYDLIIGQLYLGADYTHKFYNIKPIKSHLYWGAGSYLLFSSSSHKSSEGIGIRLPFGFMHLLKYAPLQVFLELGLRSLVLPRIHLSFDLALGIRYQF
jgi:hypothetical protein